MEERLKRYRQKLEKAIKDTLSESPPINAVIRDIQGSGLDVFLIIEATVGLNNPNEEARDSQLTSSEIRLKLTNQDERFLRHLKISPE